MNLLRQKIIDVAKEQIGTAEKPIGSNNVKYNTWYYGHAVSGANYPWCAVFISWCADQAGISTNIIPRTASVSNLQNFFMNQGLYKNKGYKPSPGDIMIQKSNGASHAGIVLESNGASFSVIEGNTSNTVKKMSYSLNDKYLSGFGTPQYIEDDMQTQTQSQTQNKQTKEINSVVIKSISGADNIKRQIYTLNETEKQEPQSLFDTGRQTLELYIINHDNIMFTPIIKEGITWETARKDAPGKLTFTVMKDDIISFNEGSTVIFKANGKEIFYGYVFTKTRDKKHHINVTAYDQIRYLKSKHTYIYQNKGPEDLIRLIADDFGLKVGELDNTGYKIPARLEDNKTLLDMIQNLIYEACLSTGNIFVLYDDFGKLTLKNIKNLKINDLLFNGDNTQNFDYKTTIDNNAYNKVIIYRDNTETGQREFYIAQDPYKIKRWGLLQLTETASEQENAAVKAKLILDYYNAIDRQITLKKALGDYRLRAGFCVYNYFDLGDMILKKLMLIEKAVHYFDTHSHFMDLTLVGVKW